MNARAPNTTTRSVLTLLPCVRIRVTAGESELVVLLADVLLQFVARRAVLGGEFQREWPGECAGVIDGHFVVEGAVVDPRPPLDDVKLLGVRRAAAVPPPLVVEPDRIDHQGVLLPVADRLAEPGRRRILGVLPAVHEDLPVIPEAFPQD